MKAAEIFAEPRACYQCALQNRPGAGARPVSEIMGGAHAVLGCGHVYPLAEDEIAGVAADFAPRRPPVYLRPGR